MAETTIVSFAALPSCATECYHLYDANGACVPPAVSTADALTYGSCFCSNTLVAPFSTGTAGVCDDACTTQADGLASIHTWFSSYCSENAKELAAETTTTSSSSASTSSSSSSSSKGTSAGNAWLNSHWRWVIFICVVVAGIAAIWIGACIWRRRYLRNKDRQYAVGKSLAAHATDGTPGDSSAAPGARPQSNVPMGVFAPAKTNAAHPYQEKDQTGAHDRRRH